MGRPKWSFLFERRKKMNGQQQEMAAQKIMEKIDALIRQTDKYLGSQIKVRLEAEDIVMSGIRSFLRKDYFPENDDEFWRKLYVIVRRKRLKAYRHHLAEKRDATKDQHLTDGWDMENFRSTPAEDSDSNEISTRLHEAVSNLPAKEQTAILLTLEGASAEERAQGLNVSVRHARRIYQHAIELLREQMPELSPADDES